MIIYVKHTYPWCIHVTRPTVTKLSPSFTEFIFEILFKSHTCTECRCSVLLKCNRCRQWLDVSDEIWSHSWMKHDLLYLHSNCNNNLKSTQRSNWRRRSCPYSDLGDTELQYVMQIKMHAQKQLHACKCVYTNAVKRDTTWTMANKWILCNQQKRELLVYFSHCKKAQWP